MKYQNSIAVYEEVAKLTNQMLLAAKQQDWDQLTNLEHCCAEHVALLKEIQDAAPLPEEAKQRKVASIKSILADDREIRNLVTPWMAKLNAMLNSNQMEQRLTRTYGR